MKNTFFIFLATISLASASPIRDYDYILESDESRGSCNFHGDITGSNAQEISESDSNQEEKSNGTWRPGRPLGPKDAAALEKAYDMAEKNPEKYKVEKDGPYSSCLWTYRTKSFPKSNSNQTKKRKRTIGKLPESDLNPVIKHRRITKENPKPDFSQMGNRRRMWKPGRPLVKGRDDAAIREARRLTINSKFYKIKDDGPNSVSLWTFK